MLDLVRAFVGCPRSDVHLLSLPDRFILAYAFADCVVLLDARTFEFLRALTFREVIPAVNGTDEAIRCISIEPGMRLIAASLGSSVAIWTLSGVQKNTWMVHSSVESICKQTITAIDCKSGLLGIASISHLSIYTLGLADGLPEWTLKWSISSVSFSVVRFSPSLMHLATITNSDNTVRVYSTASGKLLQSLRHPRIVKDFIWRYSERSSRDDLILYTITIDATLRIFLPVLDSPQYLQLHTALSPCSDALEQGLSCETDDQSSIFWLHKDTLADSFASILELRKGQPEDGKLRRIQEFASENWDFFLRVLSNDSLVVRAVANIDRRPPTVLRQFTILQSPPSTLEAHPRHLHVLKTPHHSTVVFVTSPPLRTYEMNPALFFEDGSKGMALLAKGPGFSESDTSRIRKIGRSPDGRGLSIVRSNSVETWHVRSDIADMKRLGTWDGADLVAVLDQGRRLALYSERNEIPTLTLVQCSCTDATASLDVPPLKNLFTLSSQSSTYVVGVTATHDLFRIKIPPLCTLPSSPYTLHLLPTSSLNTDSPLVDLLPVDPMAWSGFPKSAGDHDALLSISQNGDLAFWSFSNTASQSWTCTGRVATGKDKYRIASCSSAKKTAFVTSNSSGEELTIWDSKTSEFASGLEFSKTYSEENVRDLDWTSTPTLDSILAVGFATHVEILCQQRMTYFESEPAWGVITKIEIGSMLTHEITDSSWLAAGSLLIGAGHHMLQYGQKRPNPLTEVAQPGIFEVVTRLNGPLSDYHPQMILQCLLWGKMDLVKTIIERLCAHLELLKQASNSAWKPLEVESFLGAILDSESEKANPVRYMSLFKQSIPDIDDEDPGKFSPKLVEKVIDELHDEPLPDLTPLEHEHLIVLIQTRLEIEQQRRALDGNGLRYLTSMRSFYILNARASTPRSPRSPGSSARLQSSQQTTGRRKLRYRDMIWAFHSESQEILLSASASACGGSMTWSDARALGLALWVTSVGSLKAQLEIVARNQFMSGDDRDPTRCSLLYFALGKVRLVHGLWRQAPGHKESALMLKFLSNDFSLPRWKTAALKNAYALLGKQRFEYAAAFFVLGGGVRDAVNVCVRNLNDPLLAVALARVLEPEPCGPVLKELLSTVIVPLAFREGNRWLGSWAFWMMNRRDLAVRILVTPLEQIAKSLDFKIQDKDIGEPHYDDPSLALLFSQLKSKTLQTVKGAHEISGQTEFNFVLQTARVFRRMGCHALALALVKTWKFERLEVLAKLRPVEKSEDVLDPLPTVSSRPSFGFGRHSRRASILIDMDVPSDPSTRATSPVQKSAQSTEEQAQTKSPTSLQKKTGLGTLMKSAKQDVNVPEFDMNAFF